MRRIHDHFSVVNNLSTVAILTRAGYRVRGKRADCPTCAGGSRLTVSFTTDGRFFCFRCGKGGHIRQLARRQGLSLSEPRIGKASIKKMEFKRWLARKTSEMSREEHWLSRRREYAVAALEFFPDMPEAWQALADYYHAEQTFAEFWQHCSDRCGRYWLYRHWRKFC